MGLTSAKRVVLRQPTSTDADGNRFAVSVTLSSTSPHLVNAAHFSTQPTGLGSGLNFLKPMPGTTCGFAILRGRCALQPARSSLRALACAL